MTNGYYKVKDKIFTNKILALIEASTSKENISFHYYDEVYENVSRNTLGTISLPEWYKIRALQLRDSYDYLVLNYSGGSDSHNILWAFLNNNIHLDCIFVQVPLRLVDKNLYAVNSLDKSNANIYSEWDLVIKKDLEFIAKHFPKIRIELGDFTENFSENFYDDNIFNFEAGVTPNFSRSLKLNTRSKFERDMSYNGKTVGSIFGAEKPQIVEKENKIFFYFNDKGFLSKQNDINTESSIEYFYNTPKLPNLAVEMAHQMFLFFQKNKNLMHIIKAKSLRSDTKDWSLKDYYSEMSDYAEYVKKVCYPYWDFTRFQADKPVPGESNLPPGVKLWDFLLLKLENSERILGSYKYHYNSYLNLIDRKYLLGGEPRVLHTKWHFLSDIQP